MPWRSTFGSGAHTLILRGDGVKVAERGSSRQLNMTLGGDCTDQAPVLDDGVGTGNGAGLYDFQGRPSSAS